MNKVEKQNIKSALRLTLPVMAGYIFLGFAFGLLMRTNGFPFWLPIVMSIVIYSGALEFAAVPLLSAAFDPVGSFILGLLMSARHLFYGIPLLKRYNECGKSKFLFAWGLTDETFSILSSSEVPDGLKEKKFFFIVTLVNFFYWVFGTTMGSLVGSYINYDLRGLDFSLTALFVVLFIEQLKNKEGLKSGFSGLIASACVLALIGSEYFVLVSMLVILLILILGKKVISHE